MEAWWPLLPSLIAGLLIGMGVKRALRTTIIIAGIAIIALMLLARFGVDSASLEEWVRSSAAWAGDSAEGAGQYLKALLPATTAAAVGGFIGFRL